MSRPLLCRNDTQCRPRFGDIWRCRRHVGDTSATCGAKYCGEDALGTSSMVCRDKGALGTPLPMNVEDVVGGGSGGGSGSGAATATGGGGMTAVGPRPSHSWD